MKNKEEFQTLITQNKSYELRITENGLKDAFDSLKVYRFSQYKNTADILMKFQQINDRQKSENPIKSKFAEFEANKDYSLHPELDNDSVDN